MARQMSEHAAAAKMIRTALKAEGILYTSVRSSSFSMGDSVDVRVLDCTPDQVKRAEEICDRHQAGDFNGMEDMYEYRSDRDPSIPTSKYVTLNRDYSDAMKQKAWNYLLCSGDSRYNDCPRVFDGNYELRDDNGSWGFNQNRYMAALVRNVFDGTFDKDHFDGYRNADKSKYDYVGFWNNVGDITSDHLTDAALEKMNYWFIKMELRYTRGRLFETQDEAWKQRDHIAILSNEVRQLKEGSTEPEIKVVKFDKITDTDNQVLADYAHLYSEAVDEYRYEVSPAVNLRLLSNLKQFMTKMEVTLNTGRRKRSRRVIMD